MKVVHMLGLGFALALCAAPGLALAASDEKKADAPELSAYERTGKMESCITAHNIENSEILNNHQILFHMIGGDAYLAEADCPGLNRSLSIAYDATPNVLCNSTIVHLFQSGSPVPQRGTCGLSQFELLKKKHKS